MDHHADRSGRLRRSLGLPGIRMVRTSGLPLAEPFADPQQLGQWILRDLTAAIERLYPESGTQDQVVRIAAEHESCQVEHGQ